MAWIESHTVLIRHRKLVECARDLRLKPVYLLGHLHGLWHAALEQAEDGDLSAWSDEFIAESACYLGDALQFVSLLQTHKWLDGKMIHDWLDYAGRYLESKYKTSNPEKLQAIKDKHKIVSSLPKDKLKTDSSKSLDSPPTKPTNLPNQTNQTNRAGLDCDFGFGLEKRLDALGLKQSTWSKYKDSDIVEVLRLYDTKIEKGETFKNPQGWILSELKKHDTSDIPEEKIVEVIENLKSSEAYARGHCPPKGKTLRQYAIEKIRNNGKAKAVL